MTKTESEGREVEDEERLEREVQTCKRTTRGAAGSGEGKECERERKRERVLCGVERGEGVAVDGIQQPCSSQGRDSVENRSE